MVRGATGNPTEGLRLSRLGRPPGESRRLLENDPPTGCRPVHEETGGEVGPVVDSVGWSVSGTPTRVPPSGPCFSGRTRSRLSRPVLSPHLGDERHRTDTGLPTSDRNASATRPGLETSLYLDDVDFRWVRGTGPGSLYHRTNTVLSRSPPSVVPPVDDPTPRPTSPDRVGAVPDLIGTRETRTKEYPLCLDDWGVSLVPGRSTTSVRTGHEWYRNVGYLRLYYRTPRLPPRLGTRYSCLLSAPVTPSTLQVSLGSTDPKGYSSP